MNYGYFDDKNKEYIITNPKTPLKWINYIGDLSFGGFVDHTGGSLICKGDPALNRITKYIPQLPDSDFKGTTLYLRIIDKGKVTVFSPYFVPTIDPYTLYRCHVGLGYTRIISVFHGIQSEITIFVPINGEQEIRDIRITNMRDDPLEVDVIPVVEYSHPNALLQFTNADWIPQTMQSEALLEEGKTVILLQYPFMYKENQINYFSSNHIISSFETDREILLGENGYGTWRKPLSLNETELSSTQVQRGNNIAALMHHLGRVESKESRRIITQLGQANSREKIPLSVIKFRNMKTVDDAFQEVQSFWDEYLSGVVVKTPDQNMNNMLNVHNPRQVFITNTWSRYLSLFQLGFGSRGIGFRDSSQDIMGITAHNPERAKNLIRKLLSVQRRDGSAMHSYNPLTMIGNIGDSHEIEDRPKFYSDDHLWVILTICEYLKETGDFNFLSEEVAFYEKDENDHPIERGPVLDHIQRGFQFTKSNVGSHSLPLLGFADWNDTVNLRTGAESIFTANLYGKALLEVIELFHFLGDKIIETELKEDYNHLGDVLNRVAWDGDWYIRYFDSDGTPIGSKNNSEGKIFTNAQSWAVISGLANEQRGKRALDSVCQHLNTSKGIKLSTPGFNGFDPSKGGVSTYPPGAKENGGIFLHTNPWVIIAETMLGNGDRAFQYYNQINPAGKNDVIEEFESEPYVYPQNILGDEHPQFGLARNHWLTGTASWVYQAATQFILGIQPTYKGLRINPCIPKNWSGYEITRVFRGTTYQITIKNPGKISKGIKSIIFDNEELTSNVLPILNDGKDHIVIATLGIV